MRRLQPFAVTIAAAALAATAVSARQAQQPAQQHQPAQTQQPPAAQPPPPAQQPTPQQQPPTFRAGTNLVRVDVAVSDKKGTPLTTLTKDDFAVTEDGVAQPIETFKLIEASGEPTDDLSLPIRSQDHARAEAARDEVRVFVIFWDEYHIGQMESAIRGREALMKFVQTAFAPTDLVAIVDPLTPSDAIEFTRDRGALADRVRKLQGRRGIYMPPRSAMEESQMYAMGDIERIRAEVTGSALEATVAFLGTIKEGRKEVLFVSEDVGPIGGGRGMSGLSARYDWLRELVRVANTNNTAIYPMDPRGLGPAFSDLLLSMAEETGGKPIRGNGVAALLPQIVRDASAFYLLGYHSGAPMDGKFHKISVKVNRPGVEVRSRQGYFAPSLAEIQTARTAAAAAEAPPDVARGLTLLAGSARDDRASSAFIAGDPIPGVTLSAPVVLRARTPLELRQLTAAPDTPTYEGHVFDRTDRMLVRFSIDGPAAADAKVTVRLLARAGAPLTTLPIAPWGSAPHAWQLDLPLGNIAPGTYMIEIGVTRGTDSTRTIVPFELK